MLAVLHPEILVGAAERIGGALDRIVARDFVLVYPPLILLLPRHQAIIIVRAVLDISAALQHEHFQSLFGEFLGDPTSADPGTDDDGVKHAQFPPKLTSWA